MISKKNINNFEKIIKYTFINKNNLILSLIHPSYLKEKKLKKNDIISNFERLEFLGDRVLGLVIASLIFNKFKEFNEGSLTKKFSYLVKKDFLYKIAIEINIDKFLKYTFKKENSRMNISILADSVESLIGGIYIDGGYDKSFQFIQKIYCIITEWCR